MKIIIAFFVTFLISYFAYSLWKGYTEYEPETDTFLIKIQQNLEGEPVQTWLFGKIAKSDSWKKRAEQIKNGMLDSCSQCKHIDTQYIETLPPGFEGIFKNKSVANIYISSDTPSFHIADTRTFLISDVFEMSYDNCLILAKESDKKLKKYDSKSICIKTIIRTPIIISA